MTKASKPTQRDRFIETARKLGTDENEQAFADKLRKIAQPRRSHWEGVYTTKRESEVSWFQESPAPSLDLIPAVVPNRSAPIIDIGGGASRLVDALLDNGFTSLTVLDLSGAALTSARARLGERGRLVRWIEADVTNWNAPADAYDVWHDRAALHFLTEAADRAAYVQRLQHALKPGGFAVIATFALDGPEKCSGLPVIRYDAASLGEIIGTEFELVRSEPHLHVTPRQATQSFQFSVFRRRG